MSKKASIGSQEIARLLMAAGKPHGFVVPRAFNGGGLILRGSNVRNRDDRKKNGGVIGWRWNNATQEADIPVRLEQ